MGNKDCTARDIILEKVSLFVPLQARGSKLEKEINMLLRKFLTAFQPRVCRKNPSNFISFHLQTLLVDQSDS